MNKEELKTLAFKNELEREQIGEILGASIHTVNSWFSGSRNMPIVKAKILREYVEASKEPNELDNIKNTLDQLVLDIHALKVRLNKLEGK